MQEFEGSHEESKPFAFLMEPILINYTFYIGVLSIFFTFQPEVRTSIWLEMRQQYDHFDWVSIEVTDERSSENV